MTWEAFDLGLQSSQSPCPCHVLRQVEAFMEEFQVVGELICQVQVQRDSGTAERRNKEKTIGISGLSRFSFEG